MAQKSHSQPPRMVLKPYKEWGCLPKPQLVSLQFTGFPNEPSTDPAVRSNILSARFHWFQKARAKRGANKRWVPKTATAAPWNIGFFVNEDVSMYINVRIFKDMLGSMVKTKTFGDDEKLINWSLLGCFGRFVPRVQATHMGIHRGENEHGTWKSPISKGETSSKTSCVGFNVKFPGVYLIWWWQALTFIFGLIERFWWNLLTNLPSKKHMNGNMDKLFS